jgi:hypothetical protein
MKTSTQKRGFFSQEVAELVRSGSALGREIAGDRDLRPVTCYLARLN